MEPLKRPVRQIRLKSNLAITNAINMCVFEEDTHELKSEHSFIINNEYSLDQARRFIDTLHDNIDNNVPVSDPSYECPITDFQHILDNMDQYEREELLMFTLSGSIRDDELVLYDVDARSLNDRLVSDVKHIIYEDYKLHLSCSNIIFRFEAPSQSSFYIKMNTSYSDIFINIMDELTNEVEFSFSTLIKPNTTFPFDDVNFITTIDNTRSTNITITDASLVSHSTILDQNDPKTPIKFIYRGYLQD